MKKKVKANDKGEKFLRTDSEIKKIDDLKTKHLNLIPRLGEGWNQHSLVTLRRQTLSRVLYYDWIYKKLVGKPGLFASLVFNGALV